MSQIMQIMVKAFNDEKNTDFRFKVKHRGREEFGYIYCHKWYVIEAAEHFKTMFGYKWFEKGMNETLIERHSFEAYYQFIRYLYYHSIETNDVDVLVEVLSIAAEYFDERLKRKCVRKITPLISVQNVCYIHSNAWKYRSRELEEFCFNFVTTNVKQIIFNKYRKQLN